MHNIYLSKDNFSYLLRTKYVVTTSYFKHFRFQSVLYKVYINPSTTNYILKVIVFIGIINTFLFNKL